MELEKLRYPIGKFIRPSVIDRQLLESWISILENFPNRLSQLVESLSDAQLKTPYRPGGWTVQQLVHHVYDSHHNSYTRFKCALTESTPVIKAYNEGDWADLHDYSEAPISLSLEGLRVLHAKLVYLLKGMTPEDFDKEFIHPENNEKVSLVENTGIYAWHSNHHYAHIENLLIRKGWK